MEWTEISNKQFLESANSSIRVRWSGVFLGDVRARKGTILSKEEWKSTIENAFLPWYKDGKNWEDSTARNFTVYEYSLDVPSDMKYKVDTTLREVSEIKLISAYHTTLGKRLVVDGAHRSICLQLKINKGEPLPEVGVIECYGTNIVEMFEPDFRHLI